MSKFGQSYTVIAEHDCVSTKCNEVGFLALITRLAKAQIIFRNMNTDRLRKDSNVTRFKKVFLHVKCQHNIMKWHFSNRLENYWPSIQQQQQQWQQDVSF